MDEVERQRQWDEDQRLRDTARLILPIEAKLAALPKDHIEQVVIWLKSIHNPPDSEASTLLFRNRIDQLRDLPDQIEYQIQAIRTFQSSIKTGILIGVLLTAVLWGLYEGWYVAIVLLFGVRPLWRKAVKFSHTCILIAKEQDQKHLLRSIGEAKSVKELYCAGLYAYVDDKDRDAHTQKIRDAVYCDWEEGYSFAEHLNELRAGID